MGQVEVLNWLRLQRDKGNNSFFSVADVVKGLQDQGFSNGTLKNVGKNCRVLYLWGKIELEPLCLRDELRTWKYKFRIKLTEM